jgi:hypothetical protein
MTAACNTSGPGSQGASVPVSHDPIASLNVTSQPAAILAEFDPGGVGWAMAKAGDALWIQVDSPVDAIVRIDIATGTTSPAVPLGWKAKAGSEGLWVVCCDWLVRVDPATGNEMLRVPMGGAFALGDGAVWLYNDAGLHRIDTETGRAGKPVGPSLSTICGSAKDLAIAFEHAWLACKEGHVVQVDLSSGEATTIPTGAGAHTLAVTEDAIWVTNYQARTVSRIDAATNVVTRVADGGGGVGITSGGGYVWASDAWGIAKIDPDTASVVGRIELGQGYYYELVWDDGIIWVSDSGSRVLKVDAAVVGPADR